MSLVIITETMKLMDEAEVTFSIEDKEFIAQYAFRSNEMELVKKLIVELQEKNADKEAIKTKYMQLVDQNPKWAEQIENLLIVLEMYRVEEEKAVKRIRNFLMEHGIDISEKVVKEARVEEIRTMIGEADDNSLEEEEVQEQAQEEIQTEKAFVL